MYNLRFIPAGGALVEVTTRTVQGRLLLRPHPDLNEIVWGILARAQRLYLSEESGSGVCAFCCLSNHYHLLVRVQHAKELSTFMQYFNANLAREVARRVDWRDGVWARRYQAVVVSEEEEAQVARLKYLLSQGVKEGLVAHPAEWPGANTVAALLDGTPLGGYWFDRTQEFFARRRREEFGRLQYATREVLTLRPLPCWEGLAENLVRERVSHLVDEGIAEGRRLRGGRPPLGVDLILKQQPHERPVKSKMSICPLFHAATREAGRALRASYRLFAATYRCASAQLRAGDRAAPFPAGSFPPALPFVGG